MNVHFIFVKHQILYIAFFSGLLIIVSPYLCVDHGYAVWEQLYAIPVLRQVTSGEPLKHATDSLLSR